MADDISALLTKLKVYEDPLVNNFMFIEEFDGADGSFIISSVIKNEVEKNSNIILVLCHNSFGHFHSIGLKLGYNLLALKESGKVHIIDIMENILVGNYLFSSNAMRNLYNDILMQIKNWCEKNVCIIIENIGNLLLIDLNDILIFIQYIRGLVLQPKNIGFICSLHSFSKSADFNIITKAIEHVADKIVILNDLKNGRANDVTGHLIVLSNDKKFLRYSSEYQYLLQDKKISIFAPGLGGFS